MGNIFSELQRAEYVIQFCTGGTISSNLAKLHGRIRFTRNSIRFINLHIILELLWLLLERNKRGQAHRSMEHKNKLFS